MSYELIDVVLLPKQGRQIDPKNLMRLQGGDLLSDCTSHSLRQVQQIRFIIFVSPGSLNMSLTMFSGNEEARGWIVQNLLEKDGLFKLSREETDTICKLTEGQVF